MNHASNSITFKIRKLENNLNLKEKVENVAAKLNTKGIVLQNFHQNFSKKW